MTQQPRGDGAFAGGGDWQPDQAAEAAFARRAGLDPAGRGAGLVTTWWWYAGVTAQFWFRLLLWLSGRRQEHAGTWAFWSTVALVPITALFFCNRRVARHRVG